MQFDPENKIVKLCAEGMAAEGLGHEEKAMNLFTCAWNESSTDFEKFTSAHFLARHQKTITEKLIWDETALDHAIKMNDESVNGSLPSLLLNIGKCHEDLNNFELARSYFLRAHSYINFLPNDGYGKMIKSGIVAGIERMNQ
ncbi:MAG TPA: rRNA adenine methyltransferase [Puia sp.]|nr:rRNA adenine methyltransferase [Puia sp.]